MDLSKSIDVRILVEAYSRLHHHPTRPEIEEILWEVDDHLDGTLDWDEITTYYKRCKADSTGLEPMDFYYLLSFLMYDQDKTGYVTIDTVMKMMYVLKSSCVDH